MLTYVEIFGGLRQEMNVAIRFAIEDYSSGGRKMVGRQVAGETFLEAYFRHSSAAQFVCIAESLDYFEEFVRRANSFSHARKVCRLVSPANTNDLEAVGCVFQPDPSIGNAAWIRANRSALAYSLCGITHTISTKRVSEILQQLITAPVYSWDAIICTSRSVLASVNRMVGAWQQHVEEKTGVRPEFEAELPVIPLGVDTSKFDQIVKNRPAVGIAARSRLGIAPDDVIVLHVGRIDHRTKLHPGGMLTAFAAAREVVGAKLKMLYMGWAKSAEEREQLQAYIANTVGEDGAVIVDGISQKVQRDCWTVADIFMSLTDNIQESFGITPVEAMAAGIPVVATNWNGYRDTVRHEKDGYLIDVCMPRAEAGEELALDYFSGRLSYEQYLHNICLATRVDLEACTKALIDLALSVELRMTMGESGRGRVANDYCWSKIISEYETLWRELSERRSSMALSPNLVKNWSARRLSPMRIFGDYPNRTVMLNDTLWPLVAEGELRARLEAVIQHPYNCPTEGASKWARLCCGAFCLLHKGGSDVETVVTRMQDMCSSDVAWRVIMWLAKFQFIAIKIG